MSKQANPKMIGGFVIGAMIILMAGLLALGNAKLFSERLEYVMYFDGDLGGLDVGAPVEFKGVKVGSVSDIQIVMDRDREYSASVPVTIELEPDRITFIGLKKDSSISTPSAVMKMMIFNGLRGQLGAQSLVTGKLKIVLALHPDTPLNRRDYANRPEIPTVQSPTEKLVEKIENLKFEELVASIIGAADGIEALARSGDLKNVIGKIDPLINELTKTLKDIAKLSQNLDKNFEGASGDFQVAMRAAKETLDSANTTIVKADGAIDKDSPMMYELVRTLKELSRAAKSIRVMAEYLERHPESLISGKGSQGR